MYRVCWIDGDHLYLIVILALVLIIIGDWVWQGELKRRIRSCKLNATALFEENARLKREIEWGKVVPFVPPSPPAA